MDMIEWLFENERFSGLQSVAACNSLKMTDTGLVIFTFLFFILWVEVLSVGQCNKELHWRLYLKWFDCYFSFHMERK